MEAVGLLFRENGINIKSILKFKLLIMKRLFVIFALAGALTACNNSADTTGEAKDSLDSLANEKKEMVDSSAEQKKDNIDSTTELKKDALDKMDSLNKQDTLKK